MTTTERPRLWGPIQEVKATQIGGRRRGLWQGLADELALRLERTPGDKALAVPFDSEQVARRAMHAIRKHYDQSRGRGFVSLFYRCVDGRPIVFVMRGPNYK